MAEREIIILERTERHETNRVLVPWIAIAGVLMAILIPILIALFVGAEAQTGPAPAVGAPESPADAIRRSLREEQTVFPFSSERAIAEKEITAMYEVSERPYRQLIQQAINELYARNGYRFEDPQWWDYYKAYGGSLSMEAARSRFNAMEELNLDRLVREREKWR